MMQYDFLQNYDLAFHGTDLIPLFWNSDVKIYDVLVDVYKASHNQTEPPLKVKIEFEAVASASSSNGYSGNFQKYFTGLALRDGNPNTLLSSGHKWWVEATGGPELSNVLQTTFSLPHFHNSTDEINTTDNCQSWADLAIKYTVNPNCAASSKDAVPFEDEDEAHVRLGL